MSCFVLREGGVTRLSGANCFTRLRSLIGTVGLSANKAQGCEETAPAKKGLVLSNVGDTHAARVLKEAGRDGYAVVGLENVEVTASSGKSVSIPEKRAVLGGVNVRRAETGGLSFERAL